MLEVRHAGRIGARGILTLLAVLTLAAAYLVAVDASPARATTMTVNNETEFKGALATLSSDGSGPHIVELGADITYATAGHAWYSGSQDLTIEGNGYTIDANGIGRILYAPVSAGVLVTLQNLTLQGGLTARPGGTGGAVYVVDGDLEVINSTIRDNWAGGANGLPYDDGGGLAVKGDLTLRDSSVLGNISEDAGGVNAINVVVINSTIANNHAGSGESGGGIHGNTVTLINSTVTGNNAGNGSGVYSRGPLSMTYSTVSNNGPGANIQVIDDTGNGSGMTSFGSVVADAGTVNCLIVGGTVSTYSYDDDGTCGFIDPTDVSNGSDPLLGALADNGGTTWTRLPGAPGDPLVDQIPAASCDATVITDQRGVTRPEGTGCDIGAVEIVQNERPVAVVDSYSVDEDHNLSGSPGVLANDSDREGDPMSAELVSGVSHGHLDLRADGSFDYVPHADWWGTDTFTYRAHDGMLYSDAATVTIDVAAVNDPPEVSDSDGPFIIPGENSCVDIHGSLLGSAWDPDGDPLTAHLYTNATHVDVTVNPDGTWCAPPTGPWPGSDTFQWRAYDGKVYSNVATVHLTTNPMEDQADLSLTTTAMPDPVGVGELLQYTLTVHNSGPDPATQVTVTDELSPLVQFKTASAECSQAAGVVTCDLGTLAVGATKVLQITVVPVASGPIENAAYADLNEFDLDGGLRSSVTVNAEPPPSDPFTDDDDSVFEADIAWMAAMGITMGCNPPDNDEFCPDAVVTRGQMAAFLTRALNLTARLVDPFVDDDDSIFEADIERLAAVGITKGCNPPDNDRFCPDQAVTRGQMAAFLVRALGYTDNGGGNLFIDDDDSIFEGDIDRLGTAGVTMGCNPPANDRFCPNQEVTRGQMAAFLHRALG